MLQLRVPPPKIEPRGKRAAKAIYVQAKWGTKKEDKRGNQRRLE